jgi:hypothetical protein
MLAFLKSELFLRFLGGFAIGAVGVFALEAADRPSLTTSAYAAPAHTPSVVDRAAG